MSESQQDPFAEIMGDIEKKFGEALFQQRAITAALTAEATGLVYTRAVSSGVPHELAQAMAAEFWDAETSQAAGVEELAGDEE
ncbi:hypothetical protein [Kitasatospora sp. MBT66]|uniref:hypothetical protein n=1 Tax=Kitasatospora sp. MBT66 TaxID=1444769 RepID=UPI0005BA38B7|nr:hypothetical protein [Kitasatospora sp. MBT66]